MTPPNVMKNLLALLQISTKWKNNYRIYSINIFLSSFCFQNQSTLEDSLHYTCINCSDLLFGLFHFFLLFPVESIISTNMMKRIL